MLQKLVIIGAGALGRDVLGLIRQINQKEATYEVAGWLDSKETTGNELGIPFLSEDDIKEEHSAVIAIGNPTIRQAKFEMLKKHGVKLTNLIHPSIILDPDLNLENCEGNILMPFTYLGNGVSLGDNNLINVGSVLSHDTKLGSHNTIMQRSVLNGEITLGDANYIGIGMILRGKIDVGSGKNFQKQEEVPHYQ